MAFTEDDNREHTAELQRHLYVISQNDDRIPPILSDGIYGEETTGAVKAFQNARGLDVTGEADPITWSLIAKEAAEHNLKPVLLDIFPDDFILLPESTGYLVYIIQILLNILSRDYDNFPAVDIDGIYSPKMHEAVIKLQEISGADPNTYGIDAKTWNMLAKKANSKDFSAGTINRQKS